MSKSLLTLKEKKGLMFIVGPIVQGWSSVIPKFAPLYFISFYVELPIMVFMFIAWLYFKRPAPHDYLTAEDAPLLQSDDHIAGSASSVTAITTTTLRRSKFHDLVDVDSVDLYTDEYMEDERDAAEEDEVAQRLKSQGPRRWLWSLYYWFV